MAYATHITKANKALQTLINMVIENEQEIYITTKKGNVVMISEELYRSLLETLHLNFNHAYKKTLITGLKTTYEASIPEDNIKW